MKMFFHKVGFSLLFGVIAALVVYSGAFSYSELFYEDAVYQRADKPDNRIKIIAIDDKTLGELGNYGDWSRQVYADLLGVLNKEDCAPSVVAFDIMFFDEKDEAGDTAFANACSEAGNVVVASKLDIAVKYIERDALVNSMYVTACIEPFDRLMKNTDTGFVNIILDNDGFVRHSLARIESGGVSYSSFSTAIYEKYTGKTAECGDTFLIDYTAVSGSYEMISMSDVLNGTVNADVFDDCIVIVGGCSEGMLDSYNVPIDRRTLMYGAEINANIVQALLEERSIVYPDMLLTAVLTGLSAALFMLITFGRRVRFMSAGLAVTSAVHFAFCLFCFENGVLIVIFYPMVAYITAYIINLIAKYASERRQRARELHELLFSMAEAMTEAVDGRTPYNASHTRKVANYALTLAEHINEKHRKKQTALFLTKTQMEQLHLAALLHDVGKLDIPLEVLDKPTRLGQRLEKLLDRYEKLTLTVRLEAAENVIDSVRCGEILSDLDLCREFIVAVNSKEWLSGEELARTDEIREKSYKDTDENKIPFLSDDEYECLTVKKGTLTDSEMQTVHMHAVYTDKILGRIRFGKNYGEVRRIAGAHHELMNGKGYPNGLSGDEIDLSVRILTISDVYDALTADDRPYKKAKSREASFKILHFMEKDGEIDGEVLALAEEIWK